MCYIRALTCFLSPKDWGKEKLKQYLESRCSKLREILDKLLSMYDGLELWTFRVALPYTPNSVNIKDVAEVAEDVAESCQIDFISAIHLKGNEFNSKVVEIIEALENYEKVFASIKVNSTSEAQKVAEVYNKVEGFIGAKVAIHVGSEFITPYFPLAKTIASIEGASLTPFIIDELKEAIKNRNYHSIVETFQLSEKFGKDYSKEIGIEYFGIDPSPSPWMDASIAEVIEIASNTYFGDYGTHWGIKKVMDIVNKAVYEAKVKVTGFNEIMLPIAEDNLLKVRAVEERYTIRDLMSYISVCVAGLDMVPVVKPLKYDAIARLIMDLKALSAAKKKPLGLRLIPIQAEPGSIIEIKMFGRLPVLEL